MDDIDIFNNEDNDEDDEPLEDTIKFYWVDGYGLFRKYILDRDPRILRIVTR